MKNKNVTELFTNENIKVSGPENYWRFYLKSKQLDGDSLFVLVSIKSEAHVCVIMGLIFIELKFNCQFCLSFFSVNFSADVTFFKR